MLFGFNIYLYIVVMYCYDINYYLPWVPRQGLKEGLNIEEINK